jgi:predicted metal-dependent hydrolase
MNDQPDAPIIVGFVSDLMFAIRIGNAARHQGFHVEWVESADQIAPIDPAATQESPGESLMGQKGRLFDKITTWQPTLLLFDLNNRDVPWRKWIPALKSSPATRRIPIMCFGPHADVEVMTDAKRVGADVVLARSRFTADLPKLLEQYARVPDHEALQTACREPLSAVAMEGIELHNQGEYFEAHEALELAWKDDRGAGRDLYRGLVQVSVAYLQIERGNYRGAVKMCLRVRHWLDPLPDSCRGVDVAHLRRSVEAFYDALDSLGPERLDELDPALLQPIRLVPAR